jgi:hypothetical protein
MGFEKGSKMKWAGVTICLLVTLLRPVYIHYLDDIYDNPTGGDIFVEKFYIVLNVVFLAVGVLIQKKIVYKNKGTSLLVICFYIYFTAFL